MCLLNFLPSDTRLEQTSVYLLVYDEWNFFITDNLHDDLYDNFNCMENDEGMITKKPYMYSTSDLERQKLHHSIESEY